VAAYSLLEAKPIMAFIEATNKTISTKYAQ
jgi:hypothetical protein